MSEMAGRTGDALRETVRDLVARQLPDAVGGDLSPDLPLREAGLSSLGMVATLVAIESEFGVSLPDDLITPETFHSLRTLATALAPVVEAQTGATGTARAEDAVS
ncbi:phosphopantetheine-binding protein [Streptomyces lydicamycinicus]|uniref:Putative non-ribosomal peptide synthetase adenylation domain protein n=1 Tax=Streptomyces lydicamycinicus TaxID=1546107 RepID=A0A0P4RAT1_9ACTN|nr:phosphopantetheine-binding protein [Streptomyces lydicamycinicus]GAO10189.1 putative non-ribosomal peptide synthetase adenylation domain protein [Streptomyces lydicamycinicus]